MDMTLDVVMEVVVDEEVGKEMPEGPVVVAGVLMIVEVVVVEVMDVKSEEDLEVMIEMTWRCYWTYVMRHWWQTRMRVNRWFGRWGGRWYMWRWATAMCWQKDDKGKSGSLTIGFIVINWKYPLRSV